MTPAHTTHIETNETAALSWLAQAALIRADRFGIADLRWFRL